MGISFEQPQPMSPAISSAYGQAAVMQQNNPLFLQQQQMRQQQVLAQQEMQQRAAEHSAALQQQAAELAQRGQLGREEMDLRQQALDQEGQVTGRDVFHAQAQMAAQAQSADLQHWYASQEMTQHEAILLQRKRQAAAEVENSNAERSVKDDMLAQIWTGTSILEAKERAARAKQIEQAIQSAKMTEQLNAAKLQMASKAAAMTAAERVQPVYQDGLAEQLDDELTQKQQAGEVGDLTPQERQAYIRREAQARGGLVGHSIIQPDGKVTLEPYKPAAGSGSGSSGTKAGTGGAAAAGAAHPTGMTPAQYLQVYRDTYHRVEKIADQEVAKAQAVSAEEGQRVKDHWTREKIKEETEKDMEAKELPKNAAAYHTLTPQQPAREPWAGVLPGKPAAVAGQQPQPAGGQPAEGGSPKPKPKETFGDLTARADALRANPAVPPARKAAVNTAQERLRAMLQTPPAKMTDAQKGELRRVAKELDALLNSPPPEPDRPPPPPAAATDLAGAIQGASPFGPRPAPRPTRVGLMRGAVGGIMSSGQ